MLDLRDLSEKKAAVMGLKDVKRTDEIHFRELWTRAVTQSHKPVWALVTAGGAVYYQAFELDFAICFGSVGV